MLVAVPLSAEEEFFMSSAEMLCVFEAVIVYEDVVRLWSVLSVKMIKCEQGGGVQRTRKNANVQLHEKQSAAKT